MSYAEYGPRIFFAGRPDSGVSSSSGDYFLPRKRSEGRLKLYESCTDIRAWSPNALENLRFFRELNEHAPPLGKVVPFNVIMENMIELTAQAQNELRVVQRELQKYKSLNLTPEQRKYLEDFDKTSVETREIREMKIEPLIRPLSQETLLDRLANGIVSLQHTNTYLSIYFRPDNRFRYDRDIDNTPINTDLKRKNRNASSLSGNSTFLVSRVTSCNILTEVKAARERDEANICVEYVDASTQAVRDICEVGVQTDKYKDIDDYNKQLDLDSSSSQYYESSESISTSESELEANSDREVCEKSHKRVIIQKDSEIIVLKNELGMKEDELEELRELNTHMQTSLTEKEENANILKRNFNALQEKLRIVSDKRNDEVEDLSAKLVSAECLMDQLKEELARKCQVCHFQSREIQELRKQVKNMELLSRENESLTRKAKEMERLSKEAESCGIALEQVKNVWRERDILQEQYRVQSCTLTDREDEIKQLLTVINQMSVTADTREVEMNGVVADLRNDIREKSDKIAQCEMQLVCMEREVNNLTNALKNSLNNLDESKIAYEDICEYTMCEHDACLDVQSALSALKAFIAELEECKLERRNRLREIDNLKACVACYSRETVSEITNTDFDTRHELVQLTAEDVSASSNCDNRQPSKELVNVQVQSDEVETTTTCSESEKVHLNEVISYEEIDRALATHIKHSIDKIYEISAVLQGAGDHHVQIVKEYAKQQRELQRKDLEITELRRQVTEHMLQRGEGDCTIQEQLRKNMLEKETMLEAAIDKRDLEVERLWGHLKELENQISAERAEGDTLKKENTDLVDTNCALSKRNEAQNEELRMRRDQMCELIQQIDDLTRTVGILKEETNNIDDMKKKLIDLRMKNNDLTNQLMRADEIISENNQVIAELKTRDNENKMAITHCSIKYDAMITQKHSDIVKLQDENQTLRDHLRESEINLVRSNKEISLLRKESESVAAISVLQTNLSGLDNDKKKLLAKVDSLKIEVASCAGSTANVERELQALSRKNETLNVDLETVKNTNNQLLNACENTIGRPLKDALYTLSGKIYEKILRFGRESKDEYENEWDNISGECRSKELLGGLHTSEIENQTEKQYAKIHDDKSCQQDEEFHARQSTSDELHSAVETVNSENATRKLRILERQHEEKLREIKNLINDVKLRDYEIKSLQESVTYLLRDKNDLEDKVKRQTGEYQNKLTLLKKKYDSSLNAIRKRHNENVERLQERFEDIMKVEKTPFDAESWLQSLNSKELAELHNRINILGSRATTSGESDITHTEAEHHHSCRNNPKEHRFYNKFTLHKERASRTSLSRKADGEEVTKIFNIESTEETAITELYSRDLPLKREHRFHDDDGEKYRSKRVDSPKFGTDGNLERQREKFIYRCSIHHGLNKDR